MSPTPPSDSKRLVPTEEDPYDPVFVHSRREAVIIFFLWLAGLLWAVPFCYFSGYLETNENFEPHTISTVLGIPTWLFWGIFVPWLVADVFTTWFCFCFMKDDDLGSVEGGLDEGDDSEGASYTEGAS